MPGSSRGPPEVRGSTESWAPLSVKPRAVTRHGWILLPSPPDTQQEGALAADGGETG